MAKFERSAKFTKEEKNILVDIVLDFKDVIESKKTDAVMARQKEDAWKVIAAQFNSRNVSRADRPWKSLKLCYDNIKKRTKKAISQDKIELHKTGGGPFTLPSVDETGQKLIAALKPQFTPLGNSYDDDLGFHVEVADLEDRGQLEEGQEEDVAMEEVPVVVIEQDVATPTATPKLPAPEQSSSSKTKLQSILDTKLQFYQRRIECLEAEHKIKMATLLLELQLKEKEMAEKNSQT